MSKQDKEARLAAALRENLRKRKAGATSSPAKAGAQSHNPVAPAKAGASGEEEPTS